MIRFMDNHPLATTRVAVVMLALLLVFTGWQTWASHARLWEPWRLWLGGWRWYVDLILQAVHLAEAAWLVTLIGTLVGILREFKEDA